MSQSPFSSWLRAKLSERGDRVRLTKEPSVKLNLATLDSLLLGNRLPSDEMAARLTDAMQAIGKSVSLFETQQALRESRRAEAALQAQDKPAAPIIEPPNSLEVASLFAETRYARLAKSRDAMLQEATSRLSLSSKGETADSESTGQLFCFWGSGASSVRAELATALARELTHAEGRWLFRASLRGLGKVNDDLNNQERRNEYERRIARRILRQVDTRINSITQPTVQLANYIDHRLAVLLITDVEEEHTVPFQSVIEQLLKQDGAERLILVAAARTPMASRSTGDLFVEALDVEEAIYVLADPLIRDWTHDPPETTALQQLVQRIERHDTVLELLGGLLHYSTPSCLYGKIIKPGVSYLQKSDFIRNCLAMLTPESRRVLQVAASCIGPFDATYLQLLLESNLIEDELQEHKGEGEAVLHGEERKGEVEPVLQDLVRRGWIKATEAPGWHRMDDSVRVLLEETAGTLALGTRHHVRLKALLSFVNRCDDINCVPLLIEAQHTLESACLWLRSSGPQIVQEHLDCVNIGISMAPLWYRHGWFEEGAMNLTLANEFAREIRKKILEDPSKASPQKAGQEIHSFFMMALEAETWYCRLRQNVDSPSVILPKIEATMMHVKDYADALENTLKKGVAVPNLPDWVHEARYLEGQVLLIRCEALSARKAEASLIEQFDRSHDLLTIHGHPARRHDAWLAVSARIGSAKTALLVGDFSEASRRYRSAVSMADELSPSGLLELKCSALLGVLQSLSIGSLLDDTIDSGDLRSHFRYWEEIIATNRWAVWMTQYQLLKAIVNAHQNAHWDMGELNTKLSRFDQFGFTFWHGFYLTTLAFLSLNKGEAADYWLRAVRIWEAFRAAEPSYEIPPLLVDMLNRASHQIGSNLLREAATASDLIAGQETVLRNSLLPPI